MDRRLGLLLTLAPIGVASLVYVVIVRGFLEGDADHGLAWPLLGVLPMFLFGMWLLTVTSSRSAVFLALAATAMAVGSTYETFVQRNADLLQESWFPLLNMVGLSADAVATAGMISLAATFPTGIPERRWQRIAVWFIWLPVLVGPLVLITTPTVVIAAVRRAEHRRDRERVLRSLARLGRTARARPGFRALDLHGGRARTAVLPCAVRRSGSPCTNPGHGLGRHRARPRLRRVDEVP